MPVRWKSETRPDCGTITSAELSPGLALLEDDRLTGRSFSVEDRLDKRRPGIAAELAAEDGDATLAALDRPGVH